MALQLVITDAGRQEIINAQNNGTDPVLISEVGLGTGQYMAAPTQTALQAETKRITAISGEVVAADTIHVTVQDETTDAYNVGEIGLYTDSGTLFAVFSQSSASGWIIQKNSASTLLLSNDIVLDTINAASLTIGDTTFSNPPASETVKGVVELANNSEGLAGTDLVRAMTPRRVKDAFGQFGLGRDTSNITPITGGSANDLKQTGFYYVYSSVTEMPSGWTGGPILVVYERAQLAFNYNSDKAFFRIYKSGGWGSWFEFYNPSNNATQSEAEGGTVTDKPMTPLRTLQAISQFGIGGAGVSGNISDDTKPTGIYRIEASAAQAEGLPAEVFAVLSMRLNLTGASAQVAFRYNSKEAYIRSGTSGGVYSSWTRLITDEMISTSADLADYDDVDIRPGFYSATLSTLGTQPSFFNGPAATIFVSRKNNVAGSEQLSMIAIEDDTNTIGFRVCSNGVWQPWQELAHTGNMQAGLSQNGYQKLPSGLIIQWGYVNSMPAGTTVTATRPVTFPNTDLANFVSDDAVAGGAKRVAVNGGGTDASQISFTGDGVDAPGGAYWFSIGH